MSWIKIIDYKDSKGRLKNLYDRIKGPGNRIDNVLLIHSLRPHTLEAHMMLYKNVLHNKENILPVWFLETIGIYVSILNKCSYCIYHHSAGLSRLVKDSTIANKIKAALVKNAPENYFSGKELLLLKYSKILTIDPSSLTQDFIIDLQNAGISDGEILEANQVVSYFCYVNRTVLGLGVNTTGDKLGLSPDNENNPDNWSHK